MTNQEVANRLYELNRDRKNPQAYTELYAKDIVSIEKNNLTGAFEERVGLEHLMKLSENFWNSIEEIHDGYIHEPRVFDNNIFIEMGIDITMKGVGRFYMKEMCHHVVENGKIVWEKFYY